MYVTSAPRVEMTRNCSSEATAPSGPEERRYRLVSGASATPACGTRRERAFRFHMRPVETRTQAGILVRSLQRPGTALVDGVARASPSSCHGVSAPQDRRLRLAAGAGSTPQSVRRAVDGM